MILLPLSLLLLPHISVLHHLQFLHHLVDPLELVNLQLTYKIWFVLLHSLLTGAILFLLIIFHLLPKLSWLHYLLTLNLPVTQKLLRIQCGLKPWIKKIKALDDNNTWEIVSLPSGKKPICCKWVYRIKRKVDGFLL